MVLDDVDVDLRFFVLKPIHATWIVSMYNICLALKAESQLQKAGTKAGVTDVVSGSKKLPPEGTLRTQGQYVPNLNLFQFV